VKAIKPDKKVIARAVRPETARNPAKAKANLKPRTARNPAENNPHLAKVKVKAKVQVKLKAKARRRAAVAQSPESREPAAQAPHKKDSEAALARQRMPCV
jgi:hypothetical protein